MADRKHKKLFSSSARLHHSRQISKSSQLAKSEKTSRRVSRRSRYIIIAVIILAMMAVILTILLSSLQDPERIIEGKIEEISKDYYENYFYNQIGRYNTAGDSVEDIVSKYSDTGFSRVTLNQLLYYDNSRHASLRPILTEYCDLENTYIKIYPYAPYGRTDYSIDYHYSCAY